MGRLWAWFAMALLVVSLSGWVQADQATLRITNGEWPPYLGEDEPGYGVASQIVTAAFRHAGYSVEYGFFPWSRSLYLARRGKWDGAAVWLNSEQRREDFHVSEPVIATDYVFFHRSNMDFEWKSASDLAGYSVGLTQDYDYGEVIEKALAIDEVRTETVASDRLNFEKLLAGRIDLFPMDRIVGNEMLRRRFSEEERARITWHPKPVRDDTLRLLLSRQVSENRRRIKEFNRALNRMRREGEIERLLVEALGDELVGPR